MTGHGPSAVRAVVERMRTLSPGAPYTMLRPAAEALLDEIASLRLLVLDVDATVDMADGLRRLAGELITADVRDTDMAERFNMLASSLAGVADGLYDMIGEARDE